MTAVTFVVHIERPEGGDTVPVAVFPRDAAQIAENELDHLSSTAGPGWQQDVEALLDANGWERTQTWRPSGVEGVYTAAGKAKP